MDFIDLKREYERDRATFKKAVDRVFKRGKFLLSEELESFEDEFSRYCGGGFVSGVGSCTEALYLALKAHGVGQGDEVITVSHTAVPTVSAILMTGAKPVYADIFYDDMTMDPHDAAKKVTARTKCILPVHIYGMPCRMDEIMKLARKKGLAVVEDAAQSQGALYNGKLTGTIGHAGCFSFYPTKNLGAYGDGGMVVTRDKGVHKKVRAMRQYGMDAPGRFSSSGINSRLSEIQAAFLRVKLRNLNKRNGIRRAIAGKYAARLSGLGITLPGDMDKRRHAFHLYVIRTSERDGLRKHLTSNGIPSMIHYTYSLHTDRVHSCGHKWKLPVTDRVHEEILSIPLYPELTEAEINKVSANIIDHFKRHAKGWIPCKKKT